MCKHKVPALRVPTGTVRDVCISDAKSAQFLIYACFAKNAKGEYAKAEKGMRLPKADVPGESLCLRNTCAALKHAQYFGDRFL